MNFLKQSTAGQLRSLGAFVDDTDGKTPETALTIANTDVKLIKNGAASVNKNSGGGTHRINGFYGFTFDATDTATVGELKVSIKVAGALSVWETFFVLEEAVYDLLYASGATGDVKLQGVTHTGAVIPTVTTLTNLPAITAGWLTAAGIAAGALDSKGNWNIGKTGYSLSQAFPANFASLSISAGGLVDILQTAADKVWSTAARILTASTNFNDLSAAQVNTEVDTALADYDGPTNAEMIARTLPTASYFNPSTDTVANVTLVSTVTTNSDMRGTDDALLAASAPTNFGAMAITAGGGVDAFVQGFLNTLIAETTAGNVAANFDNFYDNADTITTKVVDDVGGAGGAGDWTASEKNEIRGRLGITGTTAAGGNTPTLALQSAIDALAADLAIVDAIVDAILTNTSVDIPALIAALNDPTAADITTAVWSDTLTTYTDGEAGKRVKKLTDLAGLEVEITDAAATTSSFITDQTGISLVDNTLKFLDGANEEQSKVITTHNTTTGEMTFDEPYDNAPANGASAITGLHTHSITQIQTAILSDATPFAGASIAAILEDTGTDIPALIAALNDVSTADILASGDVDGYSLEAALKIILAMAAGKLSGATTPTIVIRAADDSKARITSSSDGIGNRTAVTLDGTG